MSESEVPEESQDPDTERIAEILGQLITQRISDGICIVCGEKVERVFQSGRSMYAVPCNHRQGQGDATAYNKHLGVPDPSNQLQEETTEEVEIPPKPSFWENVRNFFRA